jgi:hypothetical protein
VILALSVKFAKSVKQHGLVLRLQNHQIHVDLLAVEQLDQNAVVILLCDAIWIATGGLDESFERAIEKFVHFPIIIVIMSNSC